MTRHIVVVGDAVTDVEVHLHEPVQWSSDTDTTIRIRGGGSAAHVAAWLARQGVPATLYARVGDDEAGRRRAAELRALGVVPAFTHDTDVPTGTIVVLVEPDGARTMLADRGAAAMLTPDDLPSSLGEDVAALAVSGYVLVHESTRAAGLHAVSLARSAGVRLVVGPASAGPLRQAGPERFLADTIGADLCIGNEEELALLAGGDGPEGLVGHYGAVVVTRGPQGATWWDRSGRQDVAAVPAAVVDTTGAGDAFTAGLLAAWIAGMPPAAALGAGAAAAAECVGQPGGHPTS